MSLVSGSTDPKYYIFIGYPHYINH